MRKAYDVVHMITGTKLGESEKAIKFRVHEISGIPLGQTKIEWFPLSQIDKIFTDPSNINCDSMLVSVWILQQKGLI